MHIPVAAEAELAVEELDVATGDSSFLFILAAIPGDGLVLVFCPRTVPVDVF